MASPPSIAASTCGQMRSQQQRWSKLLGHSQSESPAVCRCVELRCAVGASLLAIRASRRDARLERTSVRKRAGSYIGSGLAGLGKRGPKRFPFGPWMARQLQRPKDTRKRSESEVAILFNRVMIERGGFDRCASSRFWCKITRPETIGETSVYRLSWPRLAARRGCGLDFRARRGG